ncbi:fatty acid desaturase-domain-containing protein [Mortierella sp. GBAus27b]|nr:hypothetical protein BGX31_011243 [Mortierella sp. GBA43]KAI8362437.1 fatty acid desaturase-domain-containing protein [Mortierella sp. GBAus27b]
MTVEVQDSEINDMDLSYNGTTATTEDTVLLSPTKAAEKTLAAPKVKRLALITSEDLRTPTVAWPTIAVAAGSLAVWGSVLYYGAYKRKVSSLLTFPIMTAACFASFTPVHDGTHSSIAKGPYKKLINNVVGYLSSIPLNIPFTAYRKLHLLHHRYTNTDKDPDVWDSRGPMLVRFFKWFVPDYFWLKAVLGGEVQGANIPLSFLYYGAMFLMMRKMQNKGMQLFKYWILPQRAAYWLLMWLFAYVPHRSEHDHQFSAQDNVYKMTNVTGGILNSDGFNLAVPLLNQHLHNIHHLYPQLPFSHYGRIWAKYKTELIAAGTEIHPVYSSTQGWKWDEGLDGKRRQ